MLDLCTEHVVWTVLIIIFLRSYVQHIRLQEKNNVVVSRTSSVMTRTAESDVTVLSVCVVLLLRVYWPGRPHDHVNVHEPPLLRNWWLYHI